MDCQKKVLITVSVVSLTSVGIWWWYRKMRSEKLPQKWKAIGKVGELHLYPLKSGHRLELQEAACEKYGLVQINKNGNFPLRDRCLVVYGDGVTDGTYEFKTARTYPNMVLIEISNNGVDDIALNAPNMPTLYVKIPQTAQGNIRKVRLHGKELTELVDCGDEAAAWLSKYIKGNETGLRLGFHDQKLKDRNINFKLVDELKFYPKIKQSDLGIFSDLTGFMLMNKSSIEDLNLRLDKEVSFCQFRPNILVHDVDIPYVEENWDWIKIGDEAVFQNVKPCTRCVFTTIDVETGVMDSNKEPLKTLKSYKQLTNEEERKASGNSPVMGINLGLRKPGVIRVNDMIYINDI